MYKPLLHLYNKTPKVNLLYQNATFLLPSRLRSTWKKALVHDLYKRRLEQGPEPERHRSEFVNWNYSSEVYAFGQRLNEQFNDATLRQALIDRSYVDLEKEKRAKLAAQSATNEKEELAAVDIKDNADLKNKGHNLTTMYVKAYLRHHLPELPEEGIGAIQDYVTSTAKLAHVGRHLGLTDLICCREFPPSDSTVASSLLAVIGALEHDQGMKRAQLFVQDFILPQLVGQDLLSLWDIANPMGLLVNLLAHMGQGAPEPRLLWQAGQQTIEAAYVVGIYSDKRLIGQSSGETIPIAEEMAARDALGRFYGTRTSRVPFKFNSAGHELAIDFTRVNHSIEEYKVMYGDRKVLSHAQSLAERVLERFSKTAEEPRDENKHRRGPIDNHLTLVRRVRNKK